MTSGRFHTYLITTTPTQIDLRGCKRSIVINMDNSVVISLRSVDTAGTANSPGPTFQVPAANTMPGFLEVPEGELPFEALTDTGAALLTVWKQGVDSNE